MMASPGMGTMAGTGGGGGGGATTGAAGGGVTAVVVVVGAAVVTGGNEVSSTTFPRASVVAPARSTPEMAVVGVRAFARPTTSVAMRARATRTPPTTWRRARRGRGPSGSVRRAHSRPSAPWRTGSSISR